MEPVRIKYYGLFYLTRRTYLIVQATIAVLGLMVAVPFLVLWISAWQRGEFQRPLPGNPTFWQILSLVIWKNFPWIVLMAYVLEGIETVVMLRKFARKEAEQQAGSPATETTASPNPEVR